MKASTSLSDLKRQISTIQIRHSNLEAFDAFVMWFVHACLTDEELLAREALCGKSGDIGADAIFVDRDTKTIYLVQGKYRTSEHATSESRGDIIGFVDLGRTLALADKRAFSERLINAHADVKARLEDARNRIRRDGYKVHLYFVTTGQVSPGLWQEAEERANEFGELNILARRETLQLLHDYIEGVAPPVPSLDLPIQTEHSFHYKDSSSGIESRIFLMRARDLAKTYKSVGRSIFARNIRGFLGSTDINDGMKHTLGSEPQHFWYFNNGVTIVCDSARRADWDGTPCLRLANPQIINGQQTTRVIAESGGSSASVLVKVIAIPRRDDEDQQVFSRLVSKIVAATNWQNHILPSDLRANDAEQVRIEREFRKRRYQYLRKRQSKSEAWQQSAGRFDNVIKKAELAQAVGACLLDPQLVRSGKEGLFDGTIYKQIFDGRPITLYLMHYWLSQAVRNRSRGNIRRSYAKWVVLHFLWGRMSDMISSPGKREQLLGALEGEPWERGVLRPLSLGIDMLFLAAAVFYRKFRATASGSLDESTFFLRKNLHTEFAKFWESRANRYRAKFQYRAKQFKQRLAVYEIDE